MASSNTNENTSQSKTCGCAEEDKNTLTTKASENSDKQPQKCPNSQILKSGTLFLSSKGIGWTSWKKRWFVLTRTSLVFYRTDPNSLPQKGSEANPTLGGIDLNNSGSVVVKADKKLLTVLFPDGRDGRTFTLKAETSEELQEWKTALESALAQAPSAALVMSQSGILRNEAADSVEASVEQLAGKDKQPMNSMVIGRPVLLALEEIDGSPSFLEKALRFIEDYGIKVEGILRQSADVEEVERRVQEYEQGKDEFSSDEDAHVIGDCIKHVLRELPSSPVPASCCTALVEAYRTGRVNRTNAIQSAIYETFPEPNRRLLQRILKMMRTVAAHKAENRMSLSGLAACMAPLLLRPLLAGDCEFEDDFNMGGDGSLQLLKAAAAANHAQAIVIILLEDYDKIFDEELLEDGSFSSEIYTESEGEEGYDDDDDEEDSGYEYDDDDDEGEDDDVYDIEDDYSTDDEIVEGDGYHDAENGLEADTDDDFEGSSSGTLSRSISDVGSILSDDESIEDQSIDSLSPKDTEFVEATERLSISTHTSTLVTDMTENLLTNATVTQNADLKDSVLSEENVDPTIQPSQEDNKSIVDVGTSASPSQKSGSHNLPSSITKFQDQSMESMSISRRPTRWGRAPAKKNLSMESADLSSEDEVAIQKLESAKNDLEAKITKEIKENAVMQASIEKRKEALHERRSALEKEVERLQELLQKERDLRAVLESELMNMQPGQLPISCTTNTKMRADLEEISLAKADIISLKQKVAELRGQLNHHPLCESCHQRLQAIHQTDEKDQQKIANSSPLHQNINSSKTDVGISTVTSEELQARMEDLSSSPNRDILQEVQPKPTSQTRSSGCGGLPCIEDSSNIGITSLPNKNSDTDGSSLSRAANEDVKAQLQDSSSSQSSQHRKQKLFTKSQKRKKSLKFGTIPCTEDPTAVISNAASDVSTSRAVHSVSGEDHENAKIKTQDSHPSAAKQPSPQDSHPSAAKQPSQNLHPCEEPATVACDSSKSTSRVENSKFGVDTGNLKAQGQNLVPPADMQSSSKHSPITTKQGSTKLPHSRNPSSTEERLALNRILAPKKSRAWDEHAKEFPRSPSLQKKRPSQKLQQSNFAVNSTVKPAGLSEDVTAGSNASSKKPLKAEETAPSSSTALTRLTNRLNFLKERRVQLVNELQNLDTSRTLGPDPPPKTSSR